MWKIAALSAVALLAALGAPIGGATAQTPPPAAPTTQPRAAAPSPTADKPAKTARHYKRKTRHASRHKRRHTAALRCFGHEWRPFPTRDPKGYFYAPAGGGIC
jgi:hypothetical protein